MWTGPAASPVAVHTWSAPVSAQSAGAYWLLVPYHAQGGSSEPDGLELVPRQRTQMREEQVRRGVGRQVALQSGGVSREASVTAVV